MTVLLYHKNDIVI